jgi:A/G-specific adenine glycosylase
VTRGAAHAAQLAPHAIDPSGAHSSLLRWYDDGARALPWRADRDPYCVWVAEVMLQQTRVEVVIPRYERFVRSFPDLAALARASEERVLAGWSGLGYYSRARNLHRAARALRAQGHHTFPDDPQVAAALPGVGRYTLGAVLSIAYDLPWTAVDANVVRVLSRLACLSRPDARGEPHAALAEHLLDHTRPGDWNQALMELGETVCSPRAPRCDACPLETSCAARARAATHLFPRPKPRRASERVRVVLSVLHDGAGNVLLERGAFPFLPHLWLPLSRVGDDATGLGRRAGSFRHAILHRQLEVAVFVCRLPAARARAEANGAGERRVFSRSGRLRIGRSSLLTKALALALRA